jgi:hypothetical protein
MSQLPFRQQLEKDNNPQEVRERLAAGQYDHPLSGIAQKYLDSVNRKDSAEAAARTEAREEESLSISRRALSMATMANIWAAIATLIAAIAMYIAYAAFISNKS